MNEREQIVIQLPLEMGVFVELLRAIMQRWPSAELVDDREHIDHAVVVSVPRADTLPAWEDEPDRSGHWQELLEAAGDVIADTQQDRMLGRALSPALDRLFHAVNAIDPSDRDLPV